MGCAARRLGQKIQNRDFRQMRLIQVSSVRLKTSVQKATAKWVIGHRTMVGTSRSIGTQ
jgi:hypothetical protein